MPSPYDPTPPAPAPAPTPPPAPAPPKRLTLAKLLLLCLAGGLASAGPAFLAGFWSAFRQNAPALAADDTPGPAPAPALPPTVNVVHTGSVSHLHSGSVGLAASGGVSVEVKGDPDAPPAPAPTPTPTPKPPPDPGPAPDPVPDGDVAPPPPPAAPVDVHLVCPPRADAATRAIAASAAVDEAAGSTLNVYGGHYRAFVPPHVYGVAAAVGLPAVVVTRAADGALLNWFPVAGMSPEAVAARVRRVRSPAASAAPARPDADVRPAAPPKPLPGGRRDGR